MATDLLYEDYILHQQPHMNDDQRWFDWRIQLLLQAKELIVPGLNAKLRFITPYRRSSMVELGYFKDYSGIATGISLSKNPILKFSAVFGNRYFSIGTGIGFDAKTAKLANCDPGLSFSNKSILNTSLTLTDKGPSLNASSYLSMNKSAIVVEMSHRFLSKQTSIKLGIKVSPIPSVMIKSRVGIDGTIGCLVQKELFPSFFVTIEGETNVKPADDKKSTRIGISCAFKYKKRDRSISI